MLVGREPPPPDEMSVVKSDRIFVQRDDGCMRKQRSRMETEHEKQGEQNTARRATSEFQPQTPRSTIIPSSFLFYFGLASSLRHATPRYAPLPCFQAKLDLASVVEDSAAADKRAAEARSMLEEARAEHGETKMKLQSEAAANAGLKAAVMEANEVRHRVQIYHTSYVSFTHI